jgi:hypothetical protein
MNRPRALLAASLLAVTAFAGDAFLRGERAFGQRDFVAAAAAFAEAIAEAGENAPPEWRYDHALASFAAGKLEDAEASAQRAAAVGSEGLRQQALHLLGCVEWKRAEAAAAMAAQVEAEPFLFDQAIERVSKARACWIDAATGDAPRPESVRNAERALLLLQRLREQKAEKDRQRKAAGAKQRPMGVPDARDSGNEKAGQGKDGQKDQQDNPLAPLQVELTKEQLDRMFEKLEQKDREKLQLRRSLRAQRGGNAERDW